MSFEAQLAGFGISLGVYINDTAALLYQPDK
jgi:hypothetical protein